MNCASPRHFLFVYSVALLALFGCAHQEADLKISQRMHNAALTINVKNITSNTLYVAGFYYLKKENAPRWRWHKTDVLTLAPGEEQVMPFAIVYDERVREDSFGTLGVFTSRDEAERATYELTPDSNKVDIDKLDLIKHKTVIIGVEKYGIKGDVLDYAFVDKKSESAPETPELDFKVENQTSTPLFVCGFIYQKKDDMPVWRYDKTPVLKILPGESALIDVDTITNQYDRKYMRGILGVFGAAEEADAHKATYQTLKDHQKITLGVLSELQKLQDKKVVLTQEKYGIMGPFINYTTHKPVPIKQHGKKQPRHPWTSDSTR